MTYIKTRTGTFRFLYVCKWHLDPLWRRCLFYDRNCMKLCSVSMWVSAESEINSNSTFLYAATSCLFYAELSSSLSLQRRAYALVRFRFKKKNAWVGVRKKSQFGSEYRFSSQQSWLETVQLPVKKWQFWFYQVSLKISSGVTFGSQHPLQLTMWKLTKLHLTWRWYAKTQTSTLCTSVVCRNMDEIITKMNYPPFCWGLHAALHICKISAHFLIDSNNNVVFLK